MTNCRNQSEWQFNEFYFPNKYMFYCLWMFISFILSVMSCQLVDLNRLGNKTHHGNSKHFIVAPISLGSRAEYHNPCQHFHKPQNIFKIPVTSTRTKSGVFALSVFISTGRLECQYRLSRLFYGNGNHVIRILSELLWQFCQYNAVLSLFKIKLLSCFNNRFPNILETDFGPFHSFHLLIQNPDIQLELRNYLHFLFQMPLLSLIETVRCFTYFSTVFSTTYIPPHCLPLVLMYVVSFTMSDCLFL